MTQNDAVVLTRPAQSALQQFLALLQQTLPPSSGKELLNALLESVDMIDETSKRKPKQESLFRQLMKQGEPAWEFFLDQHTPPVGGWSPACLQHGTGYTCGIWQLFHILTIGVVEWNRFASHSQPLAPAVVAETIRSVIDHFFQCDECRVNFLTEYEECAFDRCQRLVGKSKEDEVVGIVPQYTIAYVAKGYGMRAGLQFLTLAMMMFYCQKPTKQTSRSTYSQTSNFALVITRRTNIASKNM